MAGHPDALVEDLDGGGRGAYLNRLLHEPVRHAVEMAFEDDVIVDVDAGGGPVAVLVAFDGQRAQGRFIDGQKPAAAGALGFAERTIVEPGE
jgi:hypothetical protein